MTKISLKLAFKRYKQKIFLNFTELKNQLNNLFFSLLREFTNVLITVLETIKFYLNKAYIE